MIARFAQTFDAQLAPGFSPERFEASIKVRGYAPTPAQRKAALLTLGPSPQDCFVLVKDPINVTVTPRKNAPKPQ